jgi:hypothetical protein
VKDRNLQHEPRVALSIQDPDNPYRYLSIKGRVAEMTENGADAHIDKMAKKYMGKDVYPGARAGEKRVIVKITPEKFHTMGLAGGASGDRPAGLSRFPAFRRWLPPRTSGAMIADAVRSAADPRRSIGRAMSSSSRRRSCRRPRAPSCARLGDALGAGGGMGGGGGKDPRSSRSCWRSRANRPHGSRRPDHGNPPWLRRARTRACDASNVATGFVTVLPAIRTPLPSVSARRFPTLLRPVGRDRRRSRSAAVARGHRQRRARRRRPAAAVDYRGCLDSHGRRLESTVVALADEIAAPAEIVMRKTSRCPVAVVRGVSEWIGDGSGGARCRDAARDLFR